ncbi:MAG: TVP38/TMEM64 family protein [Halobacteriales archaeon]
MSDRFQRFRAAVTDRQLFASPADRRRFVVHLLVVGLLVGGVSVVVRNHLPLLTDPAATRELIRGFGLWGPLVLIALQAGQVVLAPVPGQVLAVVAGYLYGAWLGTLYNMIGIAVGSTIAFWIGRRYGRLYAESIVHEKALARFDAIDDGHVRLALFFFFLVPGLPDDVLCFFGGLTRVPIPQLVLIAVVGRAPAFFLVNVFGGFLWTGQYEAAVVLALALTVASALAYRYRNRIIGAFEGT